MIKDALLKNEKKIKPFIELFNKFNKFIHIKENVWRSYSTLENIKDVEMAIIKLVSEEFETRFSNYEDKNEEEKLKLRNNWVGFCLVQEKTADNDRFPIKHKTDKSIPEEFILKEVVLSKKLPSYYSDSEERMREVDDVDSLEVKTQFKTKKKK